jgi:hypothetical protein
MQLCSRVDNVALAHQASLKRIQALVPLQDEFLSTFQPAVLFDDTFKRFCGHFECAVMEQTGFYLVKTRKPIPPQDQKWLKNAALYARLSRQR